MLSDQKVRLRALEPEDVEHMFRWENDYSLWSEGCTMIPFSKYELGQYIVNAKDIFSDKQYRFMIEDCLSQTPIGTLDLFDFDPHNQRVELGIFVEESYREKGYATDSIELIKKYVFDFLGLQQLYVHVCEENQISLSLFEKCGFKRIGRLERWVKRGDDWRDCFILQCLKIR